MTEVKIKFKDDAEARRVAAWLKDADADYPIRDSLAESLAEQIEGQVSRDWSEGMFARVAVDGRKQVYFALRQGGHWVTADGHVVTSDWNVDDVEPIRVLAEDEIAVDLPSAYSWSLRVDADVLDKHHGHTDCSGANFLRRVADVLESHE